MDKTLFKHCTQISVRSYEIDWQGIVHNAVYLQYFEVGRIEYFNAIGAQIEFTGITGNSRIVLVRNEVDYKTPAHFREALNVYSRISSIKNSSFVVEGMLESATSRTILAENVAVHAWLRPDGKESTTVPDEFRRQVQRYEGKNCVIEWPKIIV
jgi:acyl-CoA thioester hydrolase